MIYIEYIIFIYYDMENIQQHIEHWQNGAKESLETAEILIEKRKISFGLFFCHLSIEKQLKALFIKYNKDFPPKTHKLLYLTNYIGVEISTEMKLFFSELMEFQLEGRYPEITLPTPNYENTLDILEKTKETLSWLQEKLD